MGRRKKVTTKNRNSSSFSMSSTINSTVEEAPVKKTMIQEKFDANLKAMTLIKDQTIERLKVLTSSLMMSLPEDVLNTPISWETAEELATILDTRLIDFQPKRHSADEEEIFFATTATTVKKARISRSATRLAVISEIPRRSSSVGLCSSTKTMFKTPRNRQTPIAQLTSRKYNVRKDLNRAESAVNVRRLMRAGEEAISTAGSPLYVQGTVIGEPEVSIPLKNGVVLNVASKKAGRNMEVPLLDNETKQKILILCENLQKCIAEKSDDDV